MVSEHYQHRVNRAIDFIEENLSDKITLEQLATIAFFSKYHFHRIFKSVTGETLNNFVKRIKMEKAGKMLHSQKKKSVKDVAFELGYCSVANFSRDFSSYYHCSPSKFRTHQKKPITRKLLLNSEIDLSYAGIEMVPDITVFYKRVSSGYNPEVISETFKELYTYSQKNNLLESIDQTIGIGYDDPDYTPKEKCRYDACIIKKNSKLPDHFPFNTKIIQGGKYAVFYFTGNKNLFPGAWDSIFTKWVVNSEYEPANKPHFELYLPSDRYKQGIYKAKLCLPVKPHRKVSL